MAVIEPKRIAVQARVMVWRVGAFWHQRVAAADYLWDNRERKPARQCVFQYTGGRRRLLLSEQADDGAWELGEKALAKRMVSIRSVALVHAVTGDEQASWLNGPDCLRILDSTIAAVAVAPKSAWHGHLVNDLPPEKLTPGLGCFCDW